MRNRPLIALAAAFLTGILLAWSAAWAVWALAGIGATALAFGLARRRPVLCWLAFMTLTAWLGAMRYEAARQIPASDVSRLPSTSLTLTGTVAQDVETTEDAHTDEPIAAKFVLNVRSVSMDAGGPGISQRTLPATGNVAVRLALHSRITHQTLPEQSLPQYGDNIVLRGRLEKPDGPRNPGGFDYRAYLARHDIYSTLTVRQPEDARILSHSGWQNPFLQIAYRLRQGVINASRRMLPGQQSALLDGILLGERNDIPPQTQEAFERTGTAHVLATAGLHVGMVVWLLTRLLRHLRVARKPALITALAALSLYAVMAGERDAVFRAVIVAGIYLFGELLEREPDLPNALAIAALVLLLLHPLDLFDPGFQLSFATVITILFAMPIFQSGISLIGKQPAGSGAASRTVQNIVRGIATVFGLSLAAQIGAAPLVAVYFYNVSFVSVIANLFVVPAVFLVIAFGFPCALLFAVNPLLAVPFAFILRGLLSYILACVSLFSDLPFSCRNVAPPSPAWVLSYYALVWTFAWYWRNRQIWRADASQKRFTGRLVMGLAALNTVMLLWMALPFQPKELRVTFLDVGQGDACVLESPSGRVLIVDAGGVLREGEDDQGRRVVAPYLRYQGINSIDTILLTHPDTDHIGGAATLLSRFEDGSVLENGQDNGSIFLTRALTAAHRHRVAVIIARRGQTLNFGDGVTAEVLGPTEAESHGSTNNASIVIRVSYGRTSFLLTGDAEAGEEEDILSAEQKLDCDLLKVGHHGSHSSSTPEFVTAVHPKYAVISVGARNLYGHPSQDVVNRLQESGAKVYRTDKSGALTFHSDGVTLTGETMIH